MIITRACTRNRYTKVATAEMPEETVLTHGLKFGVVGTTIAALICLIFYYDAQIKVSPCHAPLAQGR